MKSEARRGEKGRRKRGERGHEGGGRLDTNKRCIGLLSSAAAPPKCLSAPRYCCRRSLLLSPAPIRSAAAVVAVAVFVAAAIVNVCLRHLVSFGYVVFLHSNGLQPLLPVPLPRWSFLARQSVTNNLTDKRHACFGEVLLIPRSVRAPLVKRTNALVFKRRYNIGLC